MFVASYNVLAFGGFTYLDALEVVVCGRYYVALDFDVIDAGGARACGDDIEGGEDVGVLLKEVVVVSLCASNVASYGQVRIVVGHVGVVGNNIVNVGEFLASHFFREFWGYDGVVVDEAFFVATTFFSHELGSEDVCAVSCEGAGDVFVF